MYVRIKTTPNSPRKSVQIVESVRDGDKVKQKIIRHVGIAMDDDELARLRDLAEHIKTKLEIEYQPSLFSAEEKAKSAIAARHEKEDSKPIHVNLRELREEQRTVVGIHEVYGKLYEELGFNETFLPAKRNQALNELLFQIVMARIANPTSKREAVTMLERDFGIEIALEKVYRMMDHLDGKVIERIQSKTYLAAKQILNEKIDILFYDCTTLYFESFTEDELKQNGYSKDFKFNQPQVLLALFVTQEGLPIGYEVFPGACFEGHTLIPILMKLRERYDLAHVIFVADRGLLSEENLSFLEQEKFDYIVGSRLKNLSNKLQKKILDSSNYLMINDGIDSQKEFIATFEQENGRNLIVSYSEKRARKDQHDREKSIIKLNQKLAKSKNPKSLLSNYGYKKFLKIEGDTNIRIDEEKLQEAACWDGLHGVITNSKSMSAEEILNHYRGLWKIEECFRVTKHDLKIRPIFHWVPPRVTAHIAIAFMAFVCVRHLEYRVALQYKKLSPEVIRKELVHVQLSFLKHQQTKKSYCVPSKVSPDAVKIYRVMGMKLSTTPFELP
jgi:transposase